MDVDKKGEKMNKKLTKCAMIIGLFLTSCTLYSAFAAPSPAGYWVAVDPNNHVKGIVHIYKDESGKLIGEGIGGFQKIGTKEESNCSKCSDDTYDAETGYGLKKDTPKMGSIFMWNYTQSGNKWTNGYIVDTATGKKYRSDIALATKDGKVNPNVLNVTGKIFIFSQTKQWSRIKGTEGVKKLCTAFLKKDYTAACQAIADSKKTCPADMKDFEVICQRKYYPRSD